MGVDFIRRGGGGMGNSTEILVAAPLSVNIYYPFTSRMPTDSDLF